MTNDTWVLAIDFGTSYTVAASRIGDRPAEVIEIDGERRMPSVIMLDESGEIVVGRAAETLASTNPGRVLRAPKSRLGEPAPVVLGGRPHSIADLVAALLRSVHDAAVRYHGSEPSEVRLTHPATWSGPRRQQLLAAAGAAGMPGATLVPEPVAAAIAYAEDVSIPQGGHVVVYDLGGGTFDTAALQASPSGFVVMGRPGGDPRLGGELFDELLANSIGESLDPAIYERLQLADDLLWTQAAIGLRREARRVKEALSSNRYADVLLGLPDGLIQQRIEQAELHRVIRPYLTESVEVMQQTAAGAGLTADDIASIYLVGGASRTPLVEELVSQAYPTVHISRRGDPKGVVAVGATHPLATPTSLAQRSSLDRASTLETPAPPPPAAPMPVPEFRSEPGPATGGEPTTVVDSGTVLDPGTVIDDATVFDMASTGRPSGPPTHLDVSQLGQPPSFASPGVPTAAGSPRDAGGNRTRATKVAVGAGVAALLGLGGIGLALSGGDDVGQAGPSTVVTTIGSDQDPAPTLVVPPTIVVVDPTIPDTAEGAPVTEPPPTVAPTTIAVVETTPPAPPFLQPSQEELDASLFRAADLNTVGWVDLAADDPILVGADEDGFCGPEPDVGLVSEATSAVQNATGSFRYLVHTISVYDSVESADQTFRGSVGVYENCELATVDLDGATYDAFVASIPFDDTSALACADDTAFIGFALTNGPAVLPEVSQFSVAVRCGSNISVVGFAIAGTFDLGIDVDFVQASTLSSLRLNNLPGSN